MNNSPISSVTSASGSNSSATGGSQPGYVNNINNKNIPRNLTPGPRTGNGPRNSNSSNNNTQPGNSPRNPNRGRNRNNRNEPGHNTRNRHNGHNKNNWSQGATESLTSLLGFPLVGSFIDDTVAHIGNWCKPDSGWAPQSSVPMTVVKGLAILLLCISRAPLSGWSWASATLDRNAWWINQAALWAGTAVSCAWTRARSYLFDI